MNYFQINLRQVFDSIDWILINVHTKSYNIEWRSDTVRYKAYQDSAVLASNPYPIAAEWAT